MDPNLTSNQGAAIVGSGIGEGPGPEVMAASSLDDTKVYSSDDQHVGEIKEIMIDVPRGRVAYAVLTTGGFLGMGDTLHAIPWGALVMDTDAKCFRLGLTADRIKNAPGFNKNSWPSMADPQWATEVHRYYEREPYWIGNPPLL
ncbi:PRC-barrel domain-containing protein [Cupriavidus sp. WKF15]|uniref:PRC-barrel domain-containing protein n=1 Tax=Cupriavidus sp. WKF15 TaxID=3032282 RepID=UPI0023E27AE8|nr:PRC-barrel domain-containing protein [Cupriavidus sp. WKF15]WER49197.1 PRC-barrel domain-containing protein [Cupriavidus sp. WKF15]